MEMGLTSFEFDTVTPQLQSYNKICGKIIVLLSPLVVMVLSPAQVRCTDVPPQYGPGLLHGGVKMPYL